MIVFDLTCDNDHVFEGWFGSSDDFATQQERGLISCPQCGSPQVAKAPMAPAVGPKGNQQQLRQPELRQPEPHTSAPSSAGGKSGARVLANGQMPPEVQIALRKLAEAQSKALEKSTWVGKKFADSARAMHYGERDAEPIHGETSLEEAERLVEEGIEVAPLPFPIAPPEKMN